MRRAAPESMKHETPAKIAMLKGRTWNAIASMNKMPRVLRIIAAVFDWSFVNFDLLVMLT